MSCNKVDASYDLAAHSQYMSLQVVAVGLYLIVKAALGSSHC